MTMYLNNRPDNKKVIIFNIIAKWMQHGTRYSLLYSGIVFNDSHYLQISNLVSV